jgi:hypothetical protein
MPGELRDEAFAHHRGGAFEPLLAGLHVFKRQGSIADLPRCVHGRYFTCIK